jgi:hypothetical protein
MPNPAKGRLICGVYGVAAVSGLVFTLVRRSCCRNEGLLELYRTHKTTKDE